MLNSTAVEQDLKSTYPTIQKTVKNGTDDKKHNSVEIGDTVDFKLASTVPDMTEYTNGYTFKFTDTLSKGLTLNGTAEGGTVRSDRQDRRYHADQGPRLHRYVHHGLRYW